MRFRPDPFILALVATAALASLVPATGDALAVLQVGSKIAIALLFFLYGARLSTSEAISGLKHWRLHTSILATTFVLFPLLGLAAQLLVPEILTRPLYAGVLLLCLVPSTVQSSVAFTSIARGNVAGAVVSASLSNLLGVFLTPLLVATLMRGTGDVHVDATSVLKIVLQLFLPFVAGQIVRPHIGRWVRRNARPLRLVDRGSILLVVYVAFSEGVNADVWSTLDTTALVGLAAVCVVLLGLVMASTIVTGYLLKFNRGDRIALLFCGSKKSLASGLPMATVLFPSHTVALIILPLMLFHQLQLIVCAWISGRLARQLPAADES
ncbi:MAG: bile acid:sodium symporter family protein [Aeromicrobium sp.]